ncbi:hypothetical protein VIBNIAM115_1710003 [Vibrio nigripulchritudo AM115]|nr:hypothetical protein TW74_17035 [Vibrio nigripulchritudo]CCN35144.1 hypothetical protein VIBNIAM115_1710003 [Vibrio nigripulchritudo AM115]
MGVFCISCWQWGDEVKTILDKPRWPAILDSQMFVEQIKMKQVNADVVDRINKLQGILPEIEILRKKQRNCFLSKSVLSLRLVGGVEQRMFLGGAQSI